jgi:hypothetical protein
MVTRQMTGKRATNNGSFSNRKVASVSSDVTIRSFEVDDQKVCKCGNTKSNVCLIQRYSRLVHQGI